MKLEDLTKLSHVEVVDYILNKRGLSKQPPPPHQVWKILPGPVVDLLACVRLRDIQVGDFIVSRVSGIEKDWDLAVERLGGGDWMPITIGSTEIGEDIVISYNRTEKYCADPINLIKGNLFIQGEVIALDFDTFLRLSLILDTIKKERLIDEERGILNSEGQQLLVPALETFYPNFAQSDYWKSWLGW